MATEDWTGRWRTSRELPFFRCAQGMSHARVIWQFEAGEGTRPLRKER